MKWDKFLLDVKWSQEITNYDEKLVVAKKIASLVNDGDVIGIGSGSTSFLATKEIAKRIHEENLNVIGIPTSMELRQVCISLDIKVASLNGLCPDWCFDGADEVDTNGSLNKGRGGAMFNEKLIMSNAKERYIIVDNSKLVNKLCEKFPIPVECVPASLTSVKNELFKLGAKSVTLRLSGKSKDGPVITENGNYIVDVMFDEIPNTLEKDIKSIVGVLESGLFIGYNVKVIKA